MTRSKIGILFGGVALTLVSLVGCSPSDKNNASAQESHQPSKRYDAAGNIITFRGVLKVENPNDLFMLGAAQMLQTNPSLLDPNVYNLDNIRKIPQVTLTDVQLDSRDYVQVGRRQESLTEALQVDKSLLNNNDYLVFISFVEQVPNQGNKPVLSYDIRDPSRKPYENVVQGRGFVKTN